MDDVLEKGPFMGCEFFGQPVAINLEEGLAAEPGTLIFKSILERYESMTFSKTDGTLNPYMMIPMVTGLLVQNGQKGTVPSSTSQA